MKSFNLTISALVVSLSLLILFLGQITSIHADTNYISEPYVQAPATLLLDNTATATGSYNTLGREILKLDLQMESKPTQIISYVPITSAPDINSIYYVKVAESYYGVSYDSVFKGVEFWKYSYEGKNYYVYWSATGNDNSPGGNGKGNAVAKPFYAMSTTNSGVIYTNLKVRDYIDQRFQLTTNTGNPLDIGDTIVVSGRTGTIYEDVKGIYVEWFIPTLSPGLIAESGGVILTAYIAPKDDFIGGNYIPVSKANMTAVYNGSNVNIGSFPNPLVNINFDFDPTDLESYVLLGKAIPYSMSDVKEMAYKPSGVYSGLYPAGLMTYSFSSNFDDSTIVTNSTTYNLDITANPVRYIDLDENGVFTNLGGGKYLRSTGETYKVPTETSLAAHTESSSYTVNPLQPVFTTNSRTILWGDIVGVQLKDLIGIDFIRPSGINDADWLSLQVQIAGYRDAVSGSYSSFEQPGINDGAELAVFSPVRPYESTADPLSLDAILEYNGIVIGDNIHPNIFAISSSISITNSNVSPVDDQEFIFNVYNEGEYITKVAMKSQETTVISHLKHGSYTIEEDESWSWRYSTVDSNSKTVETTTEIISQGSSNDIGLYTKAAIDVEFINEKTNISWFGAISDVVNKLIGSIWIVGD